MFGILIYAEGEQIVAVLADFKAPGKGQLIARNVDAASVLADVASALVSLEIGDSIPDPIAVEG